MKNYDELTNDLLERRNQYVNEQINRKKVMKRVITPICCFCLVAIFGIGLWQGDFFKTTPPITLDDSTIIGEKDWMLYDCHFEMRGQNFRPQNYFRQENQKYFINENTLYFFVHSFLRKAWSLSLC